ncbi:MAG: hypothetical protein EOP48_22775, partial [Sphingobacteriales bacterium]
MDHMLHINFSKIDNYVMMHGVSDSDLLKNLGTSLADWRANVEAVQNDLLIDKLSAFLDVDKSIFYIKDIRSIIDEVVLRAWDNNKTIDHDHLIPESIGNLKSLKYLGLSSNKLQGHIPRSLGNMTDLEHLFLGGNKFTGLVPESLGNLTALVYLG